MTKQTRIPTAIVTVGLTAVLLACGSASSTGVTSPTPLPAASGALPAASGALQTGGPLYMLSGVAFEVTPAGNVPLDDVQVYCDSCGFPDGHSWRHTDDKGEYSFNEVFNGPNSLMVSKAGYKLPKPVQTYRDGANSILAIVNGDTRFDIELVRQ